LTEYAEQGPINGWFNWPGKIVRKVSVRKSFSKVEKMRSLVIKMEEVREKKKDKFFFFLWLKRRQLGRIELFWTRKCE